MVKFLIGLKNTMKMKEPKMVKKFESLKWLVYFLLGLIPAVVFKLYAQPEASYDAMYSLIIWLTLPLLDWAQLKMNTNKEM